MAGRKPRDEPKTPEKSDGCSTEEPDTDTCTATKGSGAWKENVLAEEEELLTLTLNLMPWLKASSGCSGMRES